MQEITLGIHYLDLYVADGGGLVEELPVGPGTLAHHFSITTRSITCRSGKIEAVDCEMLQRMRVDLRIGGKVVADTYVQPGDYTIAGLTLQILEGMSVDTVCGEAASDFVELLEELDSYYDTGMESTIDDLFEMSGALADPGDIVSDDAIQLWVRTHKWLRLFAVRTFSEIKKAFREAQK